MSADQVQGNNILPPKIHITPFFCVIKSKIDWFWRTTSANDLICWPRTVREAMEVSVISFLLLSRVKSQDQFLSQGPT